MLLYVTVPNMANPKEKTPMCLVNELARFNKIQPEYKLLCEQGPAHSKVPGWSVQSHNVVDAVEMPNSLFFVLLPPVRYSLFDSHWETSTGKQRGPVSRKPNILQPRLPLLRRRSLSPLWGHLGTLTESQVGSSRVKVCLHALDARSEHRWIFSLSDFSSRWDDTHRGVKRTMYEAR